MPRPRGGCRDGGLFLLCISVSLSRCLSFSPCQCLPLGGGRRRARRVRSVCAICGVRSVPGHTSGAVPHRQEEVSILSLPLPLSLSLSLSLSDTHGRVSCSVAAAFEVSSSLLAYCEQQNRRSLEALQASAWFYHSLICERMVRTGCLTVCLLVSLPPPTHTAIADSLSDLTAHLRFLSAAATGHATLDPRASACRPQDQCPAPR